MPTPGECYFPSRTSSRGGKEGGSSLFDAPLEAGVYDLIFYKTATLRQWEFSLVMISACDWF